MQNEGKSKLQMTAEAAAERGDEKCAEFSREVLSSVGRSIKIEIDRGERYNTTGTTKL